MKRKGPGLAASRPIRQQGCPAAGALLVACLLAGCPTFGIGEDVDPNEQWAREVHGAFMRSAERGFGVDPGKPLFYDTFDGSSPPLGAWIAETPSTGDAWKTVNTQANFGRGSLTYGGPDVVTRALDYGAATLTTRDTISLAGAANPVLVLFAGFLQTGQSGDRTSLRVEASADLGFSWKPLEHAPGVSEIAEPVSTKGGTAALWRRYRFDLPAELKGQSIRLRLTLGASAGSRKLPYIDDVLVIDAR